jgi:hypothetical protein
MADSGYKSISRIDQPQKKHHGWYVRVNFKRKQYAKFFSDSKHGGREAALQAAVEYRNQTEKRIGKPRSERTVIGVSPHTQDGVVGVRRKKKNSGRKGKKHVYEVFEVTWNPEPGKVSRTSVSIDKYGEEEAFRRACEIRKAKEREIYGQEIDYDV